MMSEEEKSSFGSYFWVFELVAISFGGLLGWLIGWAKSGQQALAPILALILSLLSIPIWLSGWRTIPGGELSLLATLLRFWIGVAVVLLIGVVGPLSAALIGGTIGGVLVWFVKPAEVQTSNPN
jgi:hypothetical protein